LQQHFPFVTELPERRRRAPQWHREIASVVRYLSDTAARDRQSARDAAAQLAGQIDDVRQRVTDIERGTGLADLHRPGNGTVIRWRRQ
jgi:hypothetical protein